MTLRLKKLALRLIVFIVQHHFALLLLILLVFIAYAGFIFWQQAYIAIRSPASPLPLPSISRTLFEELRVDVLERSSSLDNIATSSYRNLFK